MVGVDPHRHRLLVVGAIVGAGVLLSAVNVLDLFGGPVNEATWLWVPAAFAGFALAIWNLWYSRWWRKLIALLAIPFFALTALLGINAAYGLDPTLGSILGISTAGTIDLDDPDATPSPDPAEPLYQTWTPPADMPSVGTDRYPEPGRAEHELGLPRSPCAALPPAGGARRRCASAAPRDHDDGPAR